MPNFAFILGRNPALSIAEIISFLNRDKQEYLISDYSEEIFLLETQNLIDINTLGGSIKIAEIYYRLDLNNSEDELYNIFSGENLFKQFFHRREGKLHFGISLYLLDEKSFLFNTYRKLLENLSKKIKDNLKEEGQSSGFVRIKDRFLSSVSVDKNELLKKGAEIILIASKSDLYVGKTIAVQQVGSYSLRDYGRPRRDKKSGILPPKLAQIMINLSQVSKDSTILDPFCGSGTILSEGAFMGYQNLIGSDIKNEAISATKENINWLKSQFSERIANINIKLFISDVNNISSLIPKNSVDAIIVEPYLGPPFYRAPSDHEINAVSVQLSSLYHRAFSEFSKILKKKARVVFIFPAFKSGGQFKLININDNLKKIGFNQINILNKDLSGKFLKYLTNRNTFLYGRGDEFIFREILVFEFN